MTELVARLKNWWQSSDNDAEWMPKPEPIGPLLDAAADEIERLTAEKAEYHGKAAALLIERDRLLNSVWAEQVRAGNAESECMRLRAALERIVAEPKDSTRVCLLLHAIAREALAGGANHE